MEIEYIPIKSDGGNLIHFTRELKNIKSILTEGFIYTSNPTRIWEEIFKDLGLKIPDIENGMICFTEMSEDIISERDQYMISNFGPFGIAVDVNRALDQGAKSVAYIPTKGPIYESFKILLKESIPNIVEIKNNTDERTFEVIQDMMFNNTNMPGYLTNPLYSRLLDLLQYVEIDKHRKEKELRIRSNKAIRGLSELDKPTQVLMSQSIKEIYNNTLSILPENVLYILCPKLEKENLINELKDSNFANLTIREY